VNKLSLIGLLIILPIIIFKLVKRKTSTNSIDSSSRVSLLSVITTLIATEMGASLIIGTSQEAYSAGLYGLLYIIGISLGYIILGCGLAAKMKALNCTSIGHIFELRYHSPFLKKLSDLLSIVMMYALLLGEIIATKALLEGLGFSGTFVFVCFWAVILLYTMLGGLRSLGISTFFQISYFIGIFSVIFVYCLFMEPYSFFGLSSLLEKQILFFQPDFNVPYLITTVVMTALYCIIQQDITQPLFTISSRGVAFIASCSASIFMIFFSLIPIYFGTKAKLLNVIIPDGMSPLIPVLSRLTNEFTVLLVLCGIILVIFATLDSLLSSINSAVQDEIESFYGTITRRSVINKLITIVNGISLLIVSNYVSGNAMSVLNTSYELYISCLLIPLLFSYFKQDVKKEAALGAFGSGLASFVFFTLLPSPISKEIMHLVLSLIGYWIGTIIIEIRLTKKSHTCSA